MQRACLRRRPTPQKAALRQPDEGAVPSRDAAAAARPGLEISVRQWRGAIAAAEWRRRGRAERRYELRRGIVRAALQWRPSGAREAPERRMGAALLLFDGNGARRCGLSLVSWALPWHVWRAWPAALLCGTRVHA